MEIYIPVWLDQKYLQLNYSKQAKSNLHSSMVRLEIYESILVEGEPGTIYIPVWLDQKSTITSETSTITKAFTFQYGQIRN